MAYIDMLPKGMAQVHRANFVSSHWHCFKVAFSFRSLQRSRSSVERTGDMPRCNIQPIPISTPLGRSVRKIRSSSSSWIGWTNFVFLNMTFFHMFLLLRTLCLMRKKAARRYALIDSFVGRLLCSTCGPLGALPWKKLPSNLWHSFDSLEQKRRYTKITSSWVRLPTPPSRSLLNRVSFFSSEKGFALSWKIIIMSSKPFMVKGKGLIPGVQELKVFFSLLRNMPLTICLESAKWSTLMFPYLFASSIRCVGIDLDVMAWQMILTVLWMIPLRTNPATLISFDLFLAFWVSFSSVSLLWHSPSSKPASPNSCRTKGSSSWRSFGLFSGFVYILFDRARCRVAWSHMYRLGRRMSTFL